MVGIGSLGTLVAIAAVLFSAATARADSVFRLAVGAFGSWETSIPELGQKAGIFAKRGVRLDIIQSQGAGETIQGVISGSIDIGIGTGLSGVLGAFTKGAPIRIIANESTGVAEFWYVPANSKIQSFKSAEIRSIAYSTTGSSTHATAKALVAYFGSNAQLVATGGPSATLVQVMSGQVDVGWSSPPLVIAEIDEGKIELLARGNDVPGIASQTARVVTTNVNVLRNRADDLRQFMQAYRETLDWMYSNPDALRLYADLAKTTVPIAKRVRDEFVAKQALLPDRTDGFGPGIKDAIDFKYIAAPLTEQQLSELIQIPKQTN